MKKIGRYEIERELGRGCMGVVHLAHDRRLHRKVALKTYSLPDGLSKEAADEYRQRFLREARAAAGISHSGVVTVYDSDQDPETGAPFIAMEYVPGRTLREILRDGGRLSPDEFLTLGVTAAGALDAAHLSGIVHRDVKPANILIHEDDGTVKIADFGVARLSTSELTGTGTTIGSPAYMSPEQIRGRTADSRSDLFSLGVILYEALCGERPFSGTDLPALAYSITHENVVPPSRLREGLSSEVDEFFDRALAKDPDERFPDGRSFGEALGKLHDSITARAKTPAPALDETIVEDPSTPAPSPIVPSTPPPAGLSGDKEWAPGHMPGGPGKKTLPVRKIVMWSMAALFLIFLWGILTDDDAILHLEGKSGVESGKLTLKIDGKTVYERDLHYERTGNLKRMVKKLVAGGYEEFEYDFELDPGVHELVAEVDIEDGASLHRETISINLEPEQTRTLRLVASGTFGAPLSLRLD